MDLVRSDPFFYVWTGERGHGCRPPRSSVLPPKPAGPYRSAVALSYPVDAAWHVLARHFCCWYHIPYLKVPDIHSPLKHDLAATLDHMRQEGALVDAPPNAFAFMMPGHVFTCVVQPVTASRSIEHVELFVTDDIPHDGVIDLWDLHSAARNEDIRICELFDVRQVRQVQLA